MARRRKRIRLTKRFPFIKFGGDGPQYFMIAEDGRETSSRHSYSAADLRSFKHASKCYTFIGELTNRVKNVGACRRGLRDAVPAAAVVAPVAPPAQPKALGRSRRRR